MMRPMTDGSEGVDGDNLMEKLRLDSSSVEELWYAWEIHCLILLSLFLQVFLFFTAGIRRRSTSSVLRTLLWLAYLSADSVAIFVLGHLAVHASGPSHHLMFFWAPFVLIHLGGQDNITAFSKQDNELWRRHLLNLVYQIGIAGYVVAKVSWPDRRLRAAMVLMFLSGCFKYAERTLCLYLASPTRLRWSSLGRLSNMEGGLLKDEIGLYMALAGDSIMTVTRELLDAMKDATNWPRAQEVLKGSAIDIMLVDVPRNDSRTVIIKAAAPLILEKYFLPSAGRYGAYEFVGAGLVHCYRKLYTKTPLRSFAFESFALLAKGNNIGWIRVAAFILLLLNALFQYVSTMIALVLFRAAEKENHGSRTDIIVSYILLIGVLVLDVSSATMYIFHNMPDGIVKGSMLRASRYIMPACSRKQWCEELAQYNMIKRHSVQGIRFIATIQQWIDRCLSSWDIQLFDVMYVPITKDIKEFILDELVSYGIKEEWDVASSRGRLAFRKWMCSDQGVDPDSSWPGQAAHDSTGSSVDFPTSVLTWHIATDICYWQDKVSTKHKEMSRQLSNYIIYLIFKCGVKLSTHSQIVHYDTHGEIKRTLSHQVNPHEEEAVTHLWQNPAQQSPGPFPIRRHPTSVLRSARDVAQELLNINDATRRWGLITSVWSEMLYYITPRCGSAFHYEHLTTGGEFATHVLLLMYLLGPFMPGHSA